MKKILVLFVIIITIVSCDRRNPNDNYNDSWRYSTPTVNNHHHTTVHHTVIRPIVTRPITHGQRVLPTKRLTPTKLFNTRSKVYKVTTRSPRSYSRSIYSNGYNSSRSNNSSRSSSSRSYSSSSRSSSSRSSRR